MTPEQKNSFKRAVVSSSCGALITSLLMTPLDVVKIRLQSQTKMMHKGDCFVYRNGLMDHLCTCFNGAESWYNRKIPGGRYTGTVDALVKIVRAEGITSLWSGLPPTLLMALPSVILYFSAYEEIKRVIGYHEIDNPNIVLPIISGGLARLISVTAVSPIELIRTKIQSEYIDYSHIFKVVKKSVQNVGIKSLYRGWAPTVLRDVPFSMIYWMNYETAKTFVLNYQNKKSLDSAYTFVCGAFSGSVAALLTCPLDVVKTHRQIDIGNREILNKSATTTLNIMKKIYTTKGIQALFAGATPRLAKVSVSCAIMITTFEYFKKLFDSDSQ